MPWPLWISAGVILLVAELHYTRDFTLFSFGASALLVGVVAGLGIFDWPAQWLGFGILSITLLFWARDWLRQSLFARPSHAELENVVGQIAWPLQDLPAFGFGKAELRGTTWNAHNASHIAILRGQRCRVMKIKGLTLWILPE
jgi:membrane protein implicated in regulation of membrane protease activity